VFDWLVGVLTSGRRSGTLHCLGGPIFGGVDVACILFGALHST
jgi:hypothetical protein